VSFVNLARREISFKIVYYGPALSGKTTNLELLHQVMPAEAKGAITMLSTRQDRTLYFDFLPLRSEAIKGYTCRFQLYTVPGQPVYNETRRIVLASVDGIVFVADSQWQEMENNVGSFENMAENLRQINRDISDIPYVLQFNKRDIPGVAPVSYMDFLLNQRAPAPSFEGVATQGLGIYECLNTVCKLVVAQFVETHNKPKPPVAQGPAGTRGVP